MPAFQYCVAIRPTTLMPSFGAYSAGIYPRTTPHFSVALPNGKSDLLPHLMVIVFAFFQAATVNPLRILVTSNLTECVLSPFGYRARTLPYKPSRKEPYMLTGTMTNGIVMLTTTGGVPIIESTAPENIPAGYHAQMGFVDSGTQIVQTWTVVPDVGTAADAAATLAQMQAASLSDDDALKVPALFPEWESNGHCYAQGDRVVYQGKLYKCLAAHTSSDTVAPGESPQRWAAVLPSTSTDTDVEE